MKRSRIVRHLLLSINAVLFIFFFVLSFHTTYFSQWYAFFCICLNILMIYDVRRNIYLFILYFFFLMYIVPVFLYFWYDVGISSFSDFNDFDTYSKTLTVHSIFLFALYVFTTFSNKVRQQIEIKVPNFSNNVLFFFFTAVSICVLIFAQSGQDIFEAGSYASGASEKSTIYEYFIVFYLLAYIFSKQAGFQFWLLMIMAVVYIFKSLLFGGRIEVIQLILLIFFLLYSQKKIRVRMSSILILVLFGYYMNVVFSNIRNAPTILTSWNIPQMLTPFSINEITRVYSSNEGDVFQSSARLIGLIEHGYLDLPQRLWSLLGFIGTIFMPTSVMPDTASLITFMKDNFNSGGGGLVSIYFFCWFGYLGPVLIAGVIVLLSRKALSKNSSYLLAIYYLLAISTFPRWFAYNPIILFKLCLWAVPIFLVSRIITQEFFKLNVGK